MTTRIGINGFGRIGRLVQRQATRRGDFEIALVNDLVPSDNLAYLMKYDSTHGVFEGDVEARRWLLGQRKENHLHQRT